MILFFVLEFVLGFEQKMVVQNLIPLFLDNLGFAAETIGLILGAQILLAGMFSYFFSKSSHMNGDFILLSGILYSAHTSSCLDFLSSVLAWCSFDCYMFLLKA